MVNQLLTKIDGVYALPNILVIGMTNRKDLLDDALLRSGRLEVQVEIGLPDTEGRLQILRIHSSKMSQNQFLSDNVDLEWLAQHTKNYSGAELEGLVKSATSFALERNVDYNDLSKQVDEDNVKITMDDFQKALSEVRPAFGASTDSLERCRVGGIIDYGPKLQHILSTCYAFTRQVRQSESSPCMSCLLEGEPGAGKTALAATAALESGFPFVKLISAESMLGQPESQRATSIIQTFEDAYKSPLSIIVLDDVERLIEFARVGPRFSNVVLQALLVLVKRLPPKGHKLFVIATTSRYNDMEALGVTSSFNFCLNVPTLEAEDVKRVLERSGAFSKDPGDLDKAASACDRITVKRLLMLLELAREGNESDASSDHVEQPSVSLASFLNAVTDNMSAPS